jgi:hypothetical protein
MRCVREASRIKDDPPGAETAWRSGGCEVLMAVCIGPATQRAASPHRIMALPQYPIDLGVPICSMEPEGSGGWSILPSHPLGRRSNSAAHLPEGPQGGGSGLP